MKIPSYQFQFFSLPNGFVAALISGCLGLFSISIHAQVSVQDDTGQRVTLDRPAQRVISLAPHLTENMFFVGGGNRLVGVSQYSDYPDDALAIDRVGDFQSINLEAILALQPDLILAWVDGGNRRTLNRLAQMGIPIYWSRPVAIESIALELNNLATLTGLQTQAAPDIERFSADLAQLQPSARATPIRVFYQVWDKPLQTLNNNSLIGHLITRCGGQNVFAQAPAVVAQVDIESVLLRNPEVVLGSHAVGQAPSWRQAWQRWPQIDAVAHGRVYSIEADLLSRHSVRVLAGAQKVCQYLRAVGTNIAD